jgi:hypothetical protein
MPQTLVRDTAVAEPLWYQRCRWCGNPAFQRLLCPTCASTDLVRSPSEGRGTVLRATVQFRNTPAERVVALVDMAEGFRLQAVVDAPVYAVKPGVQVRLTAVTGSELVFQIGESEPAARQLAVADRHFTV